MTIHTLKTPPHHFQRIWDKEQTFVIHDNSDWGFQKGDEVILLKHDPDHGFSGHEITVEITYVTNFAQKPDFVVFSFKECGRRKP